MGKVGEGVSEIGFHQGRVDKIQDDNRPGKSVKSRVQSLGRRMRSRNIEGDQLAHHAIISFRPG